MLPFFLSFSLAFVYLEEKFDDDDWEQNWVFSRHRPVRGDSRTGSFRLTSGAYYGNQAVQRGIQTMDEAAWYQVTSKFKKPFNTTGKDFVFQYTVRFENGYDCSGGYLKILNSSAVPLKFNSDSPYEIMFGPEVCKKPMRHKLQLLISRNGTQRSNNQYLDCYNDELTHAYTLIILANRTYQVRLDGKTMLNGSVTGDFELGGSEMIPDPEDQIPDDWDSREEIPDPEDHKPENWDDRAVIPDPDARQPPEWRDHVHGKWTPPLIQNPDYLGPWKPKMIANPAYRGEWTPRLIPNPVHLADPGFAAWDDLLYVAVEVFQVKPGSIFDNILVTDDIEYAEKQLRENFLQYRDDEFAMYKRVQQDKQAEEELKKLRDRDGQVRTEDDVYTHGSKSESEESSSTTVDEPDQNFNFPSDDVSDAPTAADFEFPYDVSHNRYFLERQKGATWIASSQTRAKWREHREQKRHSRELAEHEQLSSGNGEL
jgi:calreticulin